MGQLWVTKFPELSEEQFNNQKENLINDLKEAVSRAKRDNLDTNYSHNCAIFYLINDGAFLYLDVIMDPVFVFKLIQQGCIKYEKRQLHQGEDSLRYVAV